MKAFIRFITTGIIFSFFGTLALLLSKSLLVIAAFSGMSDIYYLPTALYFVGYPILLLLKVILESLFNLLAMPFRAMGFGTHKSSVVH